MRTPKFDPASGRGSGPALYVYVPERWGDLTKRQLMYAFQLISNERYTREDIATRAFLTFARLTNPYTDAEGNVTVTDAGSTFRAYRISKNDFAACVASQYYLTEAPEDPVRFDKAGFPAVDALNANFAGVPFGTWLAAENIYQGFLQTKSKAAAVALCAKLYPGGNKFGKWDLYNAAFWMRSLHNKFAAEFPHLYKPATGGSAPDMREVMNAQIRALTGGDITREDAVLDCDTWRALTELDAKAAEAEEMERAAKK